MENIMKNTIITLSVSGVIIAGLMAFVPFALAQTGMAPWVGPTNNDGPSYPTYGDDARWSYPTNDDNTPTDPYPTYGDDTPNPDSNFDDDVNAEGVYPTYGDDARWSYPTNDDNTNGPYPTYGDDARTSYNYNDPCVYTNYINDPCNGIFLADPINGYDCGTNGMLCPNFIGDSNVDGSANMNNWYYNENTSVEMNGSVWFSAFLQNILPFWNF